MPFYNAGDYDSCIGAATRYVTLHPGSPDAAYAQYLIAASHYDQIPDISRDQGRTEKAIAALEEVVAQISDLRICHQRQGQAGRRPRPARRQGDECRPLLHGQARLHRRHQPLQDRGDAVPTTRHVEEALARLTEAYMAIGIVGEAQTAAAVLGHNFPAVSGTRTPMIL